MLGEKRKLPVSIVKVVDGLAEDSTGARMLADAWGVRAERRYLLRNPIETGTRWNNVVSPSSVEKNFADHLDGAALRCSGRPLGRLRHRREPQPHRRHQDPGERDRAGARCWHCAHGNHPGGSGQAPAPVSADPAEVHTGGSSTG